MLEKELRDYLFFFKMSGKNLSEKVKGFEDLE